MRAMLQRKCGCGGACGPCKEKRELRRSAIDARRPQSVPRSVERVLGSSGTPLDPATRRALEPRFGHDFSSVRVHTGADAANAARDVHARAWTVGDHIAFGAGHGPHDRSLLAHELTHVVQQSAMPQASSLTIGAANDPAESEADAAAKAVMNGRNVDISSRSDTAIRRQELPDPFTFEKDTRDKRNELYVPGKEMTGQGVPLSPVAIARAEHATGHHAPKAPLVLPGSKPIFILHDTDAGFSLQHTEFEASRSEGPFGLGVAALAPTEHGREDPGIRDTPRPFYESHRPTTTAWEKANDTLAFDERRQKFGAIWNAMTLKQQTAFVARAMNRSPIQKSVSWMRNAAAMAIAARTEEEREAVPDGGSTVSMWTIEEVCNEVKVDGAADLVKPGKQSQSQAETIENCCNGLQKWFGEWTDRVRRTTAIEIVQQKGKVNQPAYSDKQYTDVALLYARAALGAGMWPYIVSHWQIDKRYGSGHIDPRCYNLHRLYRTIGDLIGPFPGGIFGMFPSYGTKPELHNIYWSDSLCHGGPPA